MNTKSLQIDSSSTIISQNRKVAGLIFIILFCVAPFTRRAQVDNLMMSYDDDQLKVKYYS